MADGLLTSLGEKTFPIIQKYVKEIITVSEEHITEAMQIIFQKLDMIIEPSSAVVLATLLENNSSTQGKKVGMIITGGNADLDDLPW